MTQRLDAIRRVLAVQRQLQRLAEWKLADLDRQQEAIGETQRRLAQLIDTDQPLGGLLLAAVARRRRSLAEQGAQVERAKAAQAKVAIRETGRAKLAERKSQTIESEHRRQQEKDDLAELIERSVEPTPQASGKLDRA